jgi:TetR/AcrR family transcriptional regulator, transcriptional repressor for nem operon
MKAARTRKYILEKAAPLFNKKGYDGTSLADLEKATGLTKGALYGNFGDKDTLAGEVFRYTTAELKETIKELLSPIPTYKRKLIALLDFFASYVLEPPVAGGCPLLNAAVEADDHRIAMRPAVAREIREVVESIAILLRRGIKAGEFHKQINVRELSYTFFCVIEGAIMFSRVEGSRAPMDIVVKHCKNKLDQISCNKNG